MKFLIDENLPPRLAAWLSAGMTLCTALRRASPLG
jgi:predicted nuclease of predicted toxin-antitoxin system